MDEIPEWYAAMLVVQDHINELEQRIQALDSGLHEIYSLACQAMANDDDLYLYQFARDARDIALKAHCGKGSTNR